MRKTVATGSLIIAWICCQGMVWDVVQVFAWGKMFAGHVQTMSMQEAVESTFDPDRPCSLCLIVQEARGSGGDHHLLQSSPRKAVETFPLTFFILPGLNGHSAAKVDPGGWAWPGHEHAACLAGEVAVPPPRWLVS